MVGKSRKKIVNDENVNKETNDLLIVRPKNLDKSKNDEKKAKINLKLKIMIGIIIFLVFICSIIFIIKNFDFGISNLLWTVRTTEGSNDVNNKSIKYCHYGSGIMRISNDGITYIDGVGNTRFTISYNMKEPIYDYTNKYFVVADRNSYNFVIFDYMGQIGKNRTKSPIQKVNITENGTIAILEKNDVEDVAENIIELFDKTGKSLKLDINDSFLLSGIVTDFSISDDAKTIITSNVNIVDDYISSKIVLYGIIDDGIKKTIKKNDELSDFGSMYIGRVHHFNNNKIVCFYDGGMIFIDIDANDKLNKKYIIENDKIMRSISYNDNYVAIIFEDNTLVTYNNNGDIISSANLDSGLDKFSYDNFYIDDNYIIFINDKTINIYNVNCMKILSKDMISKVVYIVKKDSILFSRIIVGYLDGVECLQFY